MEQKDDLEARAQKALKMVSLWQILRGDQEVGFRVGKDGYADAIIMRRKDGTLYEVDGRSADRLDKLYRVCEKLRLYN